jgi:two-component system, cell cycle sensor histidine kinase and response regulator CckA
MAAPTTREELERLLASTPAVIYTALPEPDFPAIFVSANVEEQFGVPAEELVEGGGWMARVHPSDREPLKACLQEGIESGEGDILYRFRSGSDEWRWVHEEFRVERDAAGRPLRFVGYFVDVTDRKEVADVLERAEERYRALIENVSDVITVLDLEANILYLSPSVKLLSGYEPAELLGQPGSAFIHPDDAPRVAGALANLFENPSATAREVYRVVARDGSLRHVESVATNLVGVPAVGGIVVNTRDITERIELESRLLHNQKMQAIGALAGGVAHDFNNLLTVIEGHASLLAQELDPDDERRENAEEIRGATRRASALTRQLLAFGKRQVLHPRVMRLNDSVLDMERMLRRLMGADVEMVVELDPEEALVRADPGQIQLVILNLVVNARDALDDGGRIAVRTGISGRSGSKGGRYCTLSVSDDGMGIPEEIRGRLFEPFFTTKPEGTGLGLSTVFGVVEQSGGRVEVESRVGEGSTFTVFLPVVEGAVAEEAASAAAPPAGASPAPNEGIVLLVEDDPAVRRVAERILVRDGFRVLQAANAAEALELAGAHAERIDLLLTDIVLPRMKGGELATRLRRARPGLPVLLMSGYSEEAFEGERLVAPELPFLQKPFSAEGLSRAVRDALGRGGAARLGSEEEGKSPP